MRLMAMLSIPLLVVGFAAGVLVGSKWADRMPWSSWVSVLPSPWIDTAQESPALPLLQYSFPVLREKSFSPATFTFTKPLQSSNAAFSSYQISIDTLDKRMTGQLNIPSQVSSQTPVIVMIRGYVPPEIFQTGVGTRNAAARLAEAGYITVAPDFFGYADSDPEPDDSWQARFEKPVIVGEIIEGIRQKGVPIAAGQSHKTTHIGIWGHSNGGQIALSVLEIMQEPIPTTLWAPVTAPFPYSILFFSDEHEDEGRAMRIWVHQLESLYDLSEFSITQYVDGLRGPLMIHHGTGDDAALASWSSDFAQLIRDENQRRLETSRSATESASESAEPEQIEFVYHQYPGADHNLQPAWNTVVERDIAFFNAHLLQESQ